MSDKEYAIKIKDINSQFYFIMIHSSMEYAKRCVDNKDKIDYQIIERDKTERDYVDLPGYEPSYEDGTQGRQCLKCTHRFETLPGPPNHIAKNFAQIKDEWFVVCPQCKNASPSTTRGC